MHMKDGTKLKSTAWLFNDPTHGSCGYDPSKEYRAIGWLGNRPLVTGDVPNEVVPALIKLAYSDACSRMRGVHWCEYCGAQEVRVTTEGGHEIRLGSAEIWVPGVGNVVYFAPNLVIQYIRDHGYQPPQKFIDAVMKYSAASG